MYVPNPVFKLIDIRLSYGISSRLQLSSPIEVMKFHKWEIPPGASLSDMFFYQISYA